MNGEQDAVSLNLKSGEFETSSEKIELAGLSLSELQSEFADLGLEKFRAKQVYSNLCKYRDFPDMTNLSKPLREKLEGRFEARSAEIFRKFVSADGTVKYLLKMNDGELVECVLLRQDYGDTLCVSCQSGCRMGCKFCASGISGLKRNLTAGEILSEVLLVNADNGGDERKRAVTNIVMMGCGEPFDNFDNVVRFLRLVTSEDGLNVSARNISVSTCGLADRVREFAGLGIGVTLCFSMHSPFDERRAEIMPVEKKFKIAEVLEAFGAYFRLTKRRFIIEYAVISGFNDRDADADELKRLLRGKVCHINLIPLNRVEESSLEGSRRDAEVFLGKLEARNLSATIRKSAGGDIDGACGQLRARYIENGKSFQ